MATLIGKDQDHKENNGRVSIKVADRPTFILKTREGESRAVSPSQRNGNKKDGDGVPGTFIKSSEPRNLLSLPHEMRSCIKFMDENMQLCDNPLDYLQEQQDFLVVGIAGEQGVGKSTILSLLTSNYASDIFPAQSQSHHETSTNCTTGIDFYVTKNRVIYLDTQPIVSCSVMDTSASCFEQKKNSTDFVNTEYNLELQSLQFTALLFSVCHVIIFVQDWFVDPNLLRFLQTAEMLKPASTSNLDQDYIEYHPHILFLHNKTELQDFQPHIINMMKNFYSKVFSSSRLRTHSGLNMSSYLTESQLNLFLIPSFTSQVLHENYEELIQKLRIKIQGVPRNSLTPGVLTEKNWYHYVSKVIDAIRKSHLSLEYGRLMP